MLKALLVSALLIGALVAQTPPPSPVPAASPQATPAASASPTATPTNLPTPLVLPPEAPPQILAVQLSDPVFHSGEVITGTVITSTNVQSVEIHLAGRAARMPRADAGIWQMTYRMPRVPFFMKGTYTAQIVAINGDGAAAIRDVSVAIK